MKRMFAVLMLLCMALCLCACGGAENNPTAAPTENSATQPQATEPAVTQPQATEPAPTEPQGATYTIKVVDEGGNPVSGMMVQLCAEICMPKMTDDNGEAIYTGMEERSDYKGSITVFKEGYEAASEETDFYFGDNNYEVTIVVKAVA